MNAVNAHGNTALHICAMQPGLQQMAELLVSAGADLSLRNRAGVVARQLASQYANAAVENAMA